MARIVAADSGNSSKRIEICCVRYFFSLNCAARSKQIRQKLNVTWLDEVIKKRVGWVEVMVMRGAEECSAGISGRN